MVERYFLEIIKIVCLPMKLNLLALHRTVIHLKRYKARLAIYKRRLNTFDDNSAWR